MSNILIFILIFIVFLTLTSLVFGLYKLFLFYKNLSNELQKKASLDFKENLELATAEQLLMELRRRKNSPFILLCPIQEKDYNGISIESHSFNSSACLAMLHLAREITLQNMKRKGENPHLPSLEDYFESE